MKLQELQDMWVIDCKIDETNLGRSAARVPELHAKYLNILSTVRLQYRKADVEFLKVKKLKSRYYRGELTSEEYKELGWEPYLLNKPMKNEMDEVLHVDDDIIKYVDKLEYLKTLLLHLEQILKSINSRTWDIKSSIEWAKFQSGSF